MSRRNIKLLVVLVILVGAGIWLSMWYKSRQKTVAIQDKKDVERYEKTRDSMLNESDTFFGTEETSPK